MRYTLEGVDVDVRASAGRGVRLSGFGHNNRNRFNGNENRPWRAIKRSSDSPFHDSEIASGELSVRRVSRFYVSRPRLSLAPGVALRWAKRVAEKPGCFVWGFFFAALLLRLLVKCFNPAIGRREMCNLVRMR